jgi:hypothetical protein
VIALFAAIVSPRPAGAQQMQDVVYLKDGSIIHGVIVEQRPGESILIRTKDGNQFRYQLSQIERMVKENVPGGASSGSTVGMKEKSAGLAWFLSFLVTGAGQAYNGQWGKGVAFFGAGVVGYGLMVSAVEECVYDFYSDYSCNDSGGKATAGLVLFGGAWIWSQIDAPLSANKINKKIRGTASLKFMAQPVALHPTNLAPVGQLRLGPLQRPARVGVQFVTLRF